MKGPTPHQTIPNEKVLFLVTEPPSLHVGSICGPRLKWGKPS